MRMYRKQIGAACTFSDLDTNILLEDISSVLENRNSGESARLESKIGNCRDLYRIFKDCDSLHEKRRAEAFVSGLLTGDVFSPVLSPSRVSAGRAFLTAEFNLYSHLCRLSARFEELLRFRNELFHRWEQVQLMLIAEEVCLGIVRNGKHGDGIRNAAAEKLVRFWEYRNPADNAGFALNMLSIRESRRTIIPAFGTLFGTFELMKLSSLLSVRWHDFLKTRGKNKETLQALEEYIFGLSADEISMIRSYMAERNITAVGDVELEKVLSSGSTLSAVPDDSPVQNYRSYLRRAEYAAGRVSAGVPGPQKTIEEIFMIYLLETDDCSRDEEEEEPGGQAMTELYLIRHGETDWNRESRVQGISDIALNEKGLGQAAAAAHNLSSGNWDFVYSSPLKRASATAGIIAEAAGINEVHTADDLKEFDFGAAEGLDLRLRKRLYPDRDSIPGAENMSDFRKRTERILTSISERHSGRRVIIVTHACFILEALEIFGRGKTSGRKTELGNLAISLLTRESGWSIPWYNRSLIGRETVFS